MIKFEITDEVFTDKGFEFNSRSYVDTEYNNCIPLMVAILLVKIIKYCKVNNIVNDVMDMVEFTVEEKII